MGLRSRSVGRTRGSSRSRSIWVVIALVAVAGAAASVFVPSLVRAQALRTAGSRAENYISDVMDTTLRRSDALRPVEGTRYADLAKALREGVPSGAPVVQITVWQTDGTVLFSTEAGLVGDRFPDQVASLNRIVQHGALSESHAAPTNDRGSRPYPGPTLVSRAALRVGGANPITVIGEVVEDYTTVTSPAEGLAVPVTGAFIVATLLAVGVLLAIALSRYEGSSRQAPVAPQPTTPTWYRGRSRAAAGAPAPAATPAVGVNTLLQRLQSAIPEGAG